MSIPVAIIYPLGHNRDTLRWFYSFDLGHSIIKLVLKSLLNWDDVSMTIQFIGEWAGFALFMIVSYESSNLPGTIYHENSKLYFS